MSYASNVGVDLIDIVAGGIPDNSTKEWLRDRASVVQSNLTGTGRAFIEKARDMYKMVSESQALHVLRNLVTKRDNGWVSNNIQAITTLEGLQTASLYMQRWIMAEPELRGRYLNQTVDGYHGSYENPQGDTIGSRQYDYRRVMDGVVEIGDEHDSYDFRYTRYHESDDDTIILSVYEKKSILNTWSLIRHYLEEGGEDPTSVIGVQL